MRAGFALRTESAVSHAGVTVLNYAVQMELHLDDIVQLRKAHPCGGREWQVVRLGADIGAICTTCGRRVLMPRSRFEKQVKRIVQQSVRSKSPPQESA